MEEFKRNLIIKVDEFEEKPTASIVFEKTKKKSFKYLYIFLFVFFSFILFYFYTKVPSFEKEEVFSFIEKYDLPADLGEYLTSTENYICFKGLNNLYIYANNFKVEPVKVSLRAEEELLYGTAEGKVIIKKNGKIYLKNYILGEKIEEREELYLDSFIENKEIEFSEDLNSLALFDKEKLFVYEIINKSLKEIYSIDLNSEKLKSVKIGKQWLVYVLDDLLNVYDLREKKEIFKYSIDTSNFYSIDLFEEEKLLAIGGWFDLVYLFNFNDNNKKYTLNLPGFTHSLKFMRNFPSLLISKGESVIIWKLKEDKILKFQESGKNFISSFLTPIGIISMESRKNKIYLFSYKDFFFSKELNPSKKEIWGLDYSDKLKLLFAGSSSGYLYSIDIKKNKLKEYPLHTQGITSVLALNDILITASDDKTIAVWQLPEMKVSFRTEAHNWLINYLYFNDNTKNLWSSSSDGYVKVLSFPGLKVLESIKTGDISNAAIWVDKQEEKLAVGTWNNQFLFFEKNNLKWELKRNYKIKSQAIYSISYLSALNALVLCGIKPFNLYIYFINEKRLFDLGFSNSGIYWIVSNSENCILAVGSYSFYLVSFDKEKMEGKVSTLINTNLKIPLISKYIKDKNIFAFGDAKGKVILLDLNQIKFPEENTFKIEKEIF